MSFQGSDADDQDDGIRGEIPCSTDNIKEFLSTKITSKTSFSYDIIS